MERILARTFAALAVVLSVASGCVIADPSPYAHGLLQPAYNHAWNNAIDAMKDEGVNVTLADLAGGRIEGRRGAATVIGTVETQKLGDVRARFAADDPELAERVQRRWQERMAH
jgi:hypothetical protein